MSTDGSLDSIAEDELLPERIQQLVSLIQGGSEEAMKILHLHAGSGMQGNAAPALRQAGLLPLLIKVLSSTATTTSDAANADHIESSTTTRVMAADILTAVMMRDVSSADLLLRAEIVRALCLNGCIDSHGLGKGSMSLTIASLQLLLVLIRRLTQGARDQLYDQIFSYGAVGKICNLLDWPTASEVSARIMGWVTGSTMFRERLRDLGLIPSLVTSCRNNNQSPFHITCVMNLALSDSLVLCLKDCDVLGVMQEVLANKEVTEVVATNAVAVVALIYGSQESCPDADRLLTVHNVAGSLVAALNSCLDGDGMHGGLLWRLSHVLKIMQSLSSREHQATMLVHVGAIQAIMRALKVTGTDGGMDPAHDPLVDRDRSFVSLPSFASIGSMGNFSSKLLDVDLDVALTGCRTLASLSSFQPLIPLLRESGVNQAMTIFQGHLDLRVADAAQSCLFLLNKAYVGGSLRKEVSRVKSGDRMRRPNNLSNVSAEDPGGVQPFDEGIEGDFIDEDEDGLEEEEDLDYDVFLSHKRTDAKDFARALYNLLVLRGLKTFLDYEFRSELNDLAKIVSRCKNLIFVLTDNVLESEWCLKELESAVDHKVNVIFVTKEGSRWKDVHGNKVCDFPPQHLIDKLPEKVKGLMTRKAIAHSDEYYQAFVDTLLKKIYQGCLKANNTKAQESSQHVAEVSQASGKSVSLHFDDLKLHSSPSAAQVLAMRAIRSTSTAFSPLRDSSASVSAASSPFQANSILPATTEGGAGAVSMQMVAGPSHSFAMAQTASSSTPVSRVHSGGGSDMLSPPYPPPHPPPQASLSPNTYPSTFASSIPGLLSSHQASLDQTLGAIQTQIRGIASQMDDIHVSFPNDLSKAHRDLSSQMHHLTSDVDLVKRELGEVRSKVQNVEASMSRLQSSMDQILSMVSHQVVPQLSVMQAFQDGLIGPLSSAIINGAISSAAGPSLRHQQEQERFSSHQQYNDQAGSSSNLAPSMPSAEASSSPYPSPSSSCFSPSHPQASKASPSNVPFLPPLILSPPHASSSSSSASAMYQTTPASLASHATASSSPVAASGQQQQQQHPLPIQGTSSVLIVGNVKSNGLGVAGRKGGGWVTRS